MFGGSGREFPHLVWYLDHVSQGQKSEERSVNPLHAIIGGSLGWFTAVNAGLLLGATYQATDALKVFGIVAGAIVATQWKRPKPLPPEPRRIQAQEVALKMRECIDRKRLHRDLDEGSLILLEECARHWARVQNAFSTGFWQNDALPVAYIAAKNHAMAAADQVMQDILILYRPYLPVKVRSREPLDYAQEAAEQFGFGTARRPHNLPVAFAPARQLADKLSDLATEAEHISESNEILPGERAEIMNSQNIESSLGELRAIRMAEEELRQSTRG